MTVKIGMIGAGGIAAHNCRDIKRHPQGFIVAVADPNEQRAQALKKDFNIQRLYSSASDLIADKDIDAVSISVPTCLHAEIAVAALKAGKHVLLDKPFAMNAREAMAVLAAAKKSGKVFILGMNQRFNQDSQTIKSIVERGDLGEIYHAKAYWLRRSGIPKLGSWFSSRKLAGGGAMLDIGVHMLDLCLYLINNFEPVTVSAFTVSKFGPRGLGGGGWGMSEGGKYPFDVDDSAAALIRMKNGATVSIEASWAMHMEIPNRNNVEIFGTDAGACVYPARVFRFGQKEGEYEVINPQGVKGPFSNVNRFSNWIDVILGKAEPCTTGEQALAVQRILDALYASAKAKKEVRVA